MTLQQSRNGTDMTSTITFDVRDDVKNEKYSFLLINCRQPFSQRPFGLTSLNLHSSTGPMEPTSQQEEAQEELQDEPPIVIAPPKKSPPKKKKKKKNASKPLVIILIFLDLTYFRRVSSFLSVESKIQNVEEFVAN